MNSRMCVFFVFSSLAFLTLEGEASIFMYQNPFYPSQSMTIYSEHDSIVFGHIGWDADFCDDESKLICVESEALVFSVPKCGAKLGDEWSYAGTDFSVVSSEPVFRLTGEEVILVIESENQPSKAHITFSFSRRSGLLGVRTKDRSGNQDGPDLFVVGEQGFGASVRGGQCSEDY